MTPTPTPQRIATVARDGARCAPHGYPIWIGAIYEARSRADGVVTWRRVGSFGPTRSGRRPSARYLTELRECVPEGLAWTEAWVRHGQRVGDVSHA